MNYKIRKTISILLLVSLIFSTNGFTTLAEGIDNLTNEQTTNQEYQLPEEDKEKNNNSDSEEKQEEQNNEEGENSSNNSEDSDNQQ